MNNLDQEKVSYMNVGLFLSSMSALILFCFASWPMGWNDDEQRFKDESWLDWSHSEVLHTNTKVVNIIAKVKESVKVITDISKRRHKHIECSPSHMKKDEEAVQVAMKALQQWNSNPWDPDITTLRSPESGQHASKQLEEDFNAAKELGEQQINQFFQERVLSDEKKIYDRFALDKNKFFLNHHKKILSTNHVKQIEWRTVQWSRFYLLLNEVK